MGELWEKFKEVFPPPYTPEIFRSQKGSGAKLFSNFQVKYKRTIWLLVYLSDCKSWEVSDLFI